VIQAAGATAVATETMVDHTAAATKAMAAAMTTMAVATTTTTTEAGTIKVVMNQVCGF
jgi:predicted GNAT superfamily acetyltransferase